MKVVYNDQSTSTYVNSNASYGSCYAMVPYIGAPNAGATQFTISSPQIPATCNSPGCTIDLEIYAPDNRALGKHSFPYSSSGLNGVFSLSDMVPGQSYKFILYTTGLTSFGGYISIGWRE